MFEEQIAKGVEYLDQDLGPSWVDSIDLKRLALDDCHRCMIGQLYGNYYRRFDVEEGFEFAFSVNDFGHYPILGREWRKKIAQLRAERSN